jgi:NADH-dependent peroxiredoxin subunit F
MYDLIIVGGGPAGAAAAVYAARKQLKTLFLTHEWGGQSVVSPDIQNWIGTQSISGENLAKQLREHVEAYSGNFLEIISPTHASALKITGDKVIIETKGGDSYEGKTALLTTGADRRKLDVTGAKEFDQKGLTYCASCDGPLFADKDVVVIGGGNAGFETAAQLSAYAKSVTLLDRGPKFRADQITVDKVLEKKNVTAHHNALTEEVLGDKFVTGLKWKDSETNEEHILDIQGVFVEIGLIPNTGWLGTSLKLDDYKRIVTDPKDQQTSHPRIWAAGDVTDALYHQNNIAAGDAVKALEDIYNFLHASKKK